MVILGNGLDTTAHRIVAAAGGVAFEVDQPTNIVYKQEKLHAIYGRVPEYVALVSVDFETFGTDDLAAALATHGFRTGYQALFIWETISRYFTEDGVRKIYRFLARAAPGRRHLHPRPK